MSFSRDELRAAYEAACRREIEALYEGAPSRVDTDELSELHIRTVALKGAEATGE